MQLRLCFVAAGESVTLVPASIAQIARTGIAYRALQPTVYADLAIARLESTAADTTLDRFVEAARKAAGELDRGDISVGAYGSRTGSRG